MFLVKLLRMLLQRTLQTQFLSRDHAEDSFAAFQECMAKGIPVQVTDCEFNQELWQPEVCIRAFKETLKLTDYSAWPHSESPATPAQFLAGYHNEDSKVRPVFLNFKPCQFRHGLIN